MKQAQILVYEPDDKLAKQLRPTCQEQGWRLREVNHANSVLNVLREGAPVFVLKVGSDLYNEMALLERVCWSFPETAVIVAGDIEHPDLAGLAWDLGATVVLLPPMSLEELPAIVTGMMSRSQ